LKLYCFCEKEEDSQLPCGLTKIICATVVNSNV
jgi:hypothetical protein